MRTRLLGYRVRCFTAGQGWSEDRFTLRQSAIECAQRCVAAGNHAIAEEITREQVEASAYGPEEWIEDEEFKVIWEPAEVA